MTRRIQLRRDTAANWITVDPILAAGEVGVDLDTLKIKVGDGTLRWTELDYYGPVDISDLTDEEGLLEQGGADIGDLIIQGKTISVPPGSDSLLFETRGGDGNNNLADVSLSPNAARVNIETFDNSAGRFSSIEVNSDITVNADSGNVIIKTDKAGDTNTWTFGLDGSLTLPAGGNIKDSDGNSVLGSGSADTGDITFTDTTISTADDEQRIQIQTRDDDGEWNTRITMDPEDVYIRMEVRNGDKVSRIDLDQVDNERITIEGRDIDMVVDVDDDISIDSGDDIDITAADRMRITGERVRIRSNSSEDNVEIITDNNDTQQTWEFRPDGSVTFPDNTVQTTAFTSTLSGIDSIGFDTSAGVTVAAGQLAWNSSDGTFDLGTGYADVVLQIGQEMLYVVRNDTGSVMSKGTAVYCSGVTSSARIEASPFTADNTVDSTFFLGLATDNFNSGLNGTVTHFGYVRGLDTRGTAVSAIAVGNENWAVGDKLYAHPTVAGKLTNVEPILPNQKICVASVINRHQSAGVLFVRPTQQIPTNLSELTNDSGFLNSVTSISSEDDVTINANIGFTPKTWKFGEDGNLEFPDGTTQTTAYPGPQTSLTGDVKGSVFANDSSLLVDGVNGIIPGYVSIETLKDITASSTDFDDFKARIQDL